MTSPAVPSPAEEKPDHPPAPAPAPAAASDWKSRLWSSGHFVLAVVVTAAFLIWLLFGPSLLPSTSPDHAIKNDGKPAPVVRVIGLNLIRLEPGSTLEKKIQPVSVEKVPINTPILNVTGTVVASLRQGNGKGDYWQFHTPELLTTWTDWQQSVADIVFWKEVRDKTKHLDQERKMAQVKVVKQVELAFKTGSASEKDLDEAKLKKIELEIQGAKDIHEAENAVKKIERTEAALARQLQLAGLDPELLQSLTNDVDIVMAEVPESKVSLVKVGQECTAKFFGVPGQVFEGRVTSLAPVLSKEKRTLRVLFKIKDKDDQVRAGMFGDIGLGTNSREALMVPADAVLHLGQFDYVLKAKGGDWEVASVQVGESNGKNLEILEGLKAADKVLGTGVILLKPFITQALLEAGHKPGPNGAQMK